MIRYIDIDGTICKTEGTAYKKAIPFTHAIDRVNEWYDEGDTIVYWTSRGMGRKYSNDIIKKPLRDFTEKQLKEWGCKYHELRMDKPVFDVLIDDRTQKAVLW